MAKANPTGYVCILMDMQMPDMDGLSATRALRADPMFRDLPIIAMTANAMQADLDACLAAGMNDTVTKPVDRTALASTLRKWLPASARVTGDDDGRGAAAVEAISAGAAASPPPTLDGINVADALERLGVGADALRRLLIRFADGQGKTLADLRAAVDAGDADDAAKAAHALAGAAGNLGADALREAAKALEAAARSGERDLGALTARVEDLAGVVFRSIDSLRPAPQTPAAPAGPLAAESATSVDAAVLRRALRVLQEALEHGDPDATAAAFAAMAGLPLPGAVRASVEQARRLAEDYQFEDASALVSTLLARPGTESQP
jgi:two-component system sensor histidine kinase/response regulator